ncbi:UDP-glucoronosyl and UDP-glucosyl transferase [Ancylostoma duodenale]|uniref:glucuronosyltransferase n=1 Tax=Ancylostoma duodenale TaxID=51022 RepID=A0A0C2GFU5_9BILA|nr:UDP-glucoronosyl and UDP-glucosyl transferase [Ancylostoma duodenale]
MRCLPLIFLCISFVQPLSIVVYLSLVGKSHVDFVSALINILVERGHEVDLLLARQNTLITSNGTHKAKEVFAFSFPGASPWMDVDHLKAPFDVHAHKPYMFLEYVRIATQLCRHGLASGEPARFLSKKKYDVGLTSDYDFCGYILFHQAGIKTVASFTATNMFAHQAFSLGLPSPPSCVTVSSTYPCSQSLFFSEFLVQDSLIREFFGKGFPSAGELLRSSDLVFVNANEIIEKPRPLSHKVKYIGGIALPKPKPLPNVPTANIPLHIRKALVKAFVQFPDVTFFWNYKLQGDEGDMFTNAFNVKLMEWLPQSDLLNDPRVVGFISHMGLNSFLEASTAGVPIVAIPLFADQTHNAHNAAYRGTTVIVKPEQLTTASMKRALEKILYDPRYMENAKLISRMMKNKPEMGRDKFVEWIEFAAANKGLHKFLNLPGNDIGVMEYYCIDCVLLLLFAFFVVSLLAWKMTSMFVRIVRREDISSGKLKSN